MLKMNFIGCYYFYFLKGRSRQLLEKQLLIILKNNNTYIYDAILVTLNVKKRTFPNVLNEFENSWLNFLLFKY